MPDQVRRAHERGGQIDVPLLTGWTADEGSSQKGYGVSTVEAFRTAAGRDFGERAEGFLALYPISNDDEAGEASKQRRRDEARADLYWWTGMRAKHGRAKDWGYYFDRAIPWPEHPEYQAFHSVELPYMFNNLRLMNRPWEAVDHQIAEEISSYWVNFINTGDPNGAGLPRWPEANDHLLRFGRESAAEPVLEARKLEFFLKD